MVTRGMGLSLSLLMVLLAACSGEASSRTQVVVVVASDLEVPGQLDELEISARAPDGKTKTAKAPLSQAADLPGSVGLMHPGGALGPFTVVVTGKLADEVVITREAEFAFVKGATLTLSMNLLRRCVGVMCPSEQTCTEQGCASSQVPRDALTAWDGKGSGLPLPDAAVVGVEPGKDGGVAPGSDAGMGPRDSGTPSNGGDGNVDDPGDPDAQVDPNCVPASETCNGVDDDCDAKTDEDFDLLTDSMNCGKCDTVCSLAQADSTCNGGKCEITQCGSGFADCDKNSTSGCEANLNTDAYCGSCMNKCVGNKHCCNGTCEVTCPSI